MEGINKDVAILNLDKYDSLILWQHNLELEASLVKGTYSTDEFSVVTKDKSTKQLIEYNEELQKEIEKIEEDLNELRDEKYSRKSFDITEEEFNKLSNEIRDYRDNNIDLRSKLSKSKEKIDMYNRAFLHTSLFKAIKNLIKLRKDKQV